jgi:hypothetical protein
MLCHFVNFHYDVFGGFGHRLIDSVDRCRHVIELLNTWRETVSKNMVHLHLSSRAEMGS